VVCLGIGHTRWATHGGVTEPNAHPHVSGELIAVVHNGIIENHDSKRDELKAQGYVFTSQTDTEVIAHLVHRHYLHDHDLFAAVQRAVKELEGAYRHRCDCQRQSGFAGGGTHGLSIAGGSGRRREFCGIGCVGGAVVDPSRYVS
jgi:glucosamine--fructose-6-phosphate aminotransferase (isomerizing)